MNEVWQLLFVFKVMENHLCDSILLCMMYVMYCVLYSVYEHLHIHQKYHKRSKCVLFHVNTKDLQPCLYFIFYLQYLYLYLYVSMYNVCCCYSFHCNLEVTFTKIAIDKLEWFFFCMVKMFTINSHACNISF